MEEKKIMPEIFDEMKMKGKVELTLTDKDGNIKQHDIIYNTITELHDCLVADRLAGGTDALFTHGHGGTGTGGTSASTNLVTPCAENRTAVTSSVQGAGAADNDVIVTFTLGAGVCTATITELGLFSNITYTTADMKCYASGFTHTKGATDILTVVWTITYGAS